MAVRAPRRVPSFVLSQHSSLLALPPFTSSSRSPCTLRFQPRRLARSAGAEHLDGEMRMGI
jgi:hypothetical protein